MVYSLTMRNIKTILVLGILVAVLPYTGLPNSWKSYSLLILGSLIAILSFRILLQERNKLSNSQKSQKVLDEENNTQNTEQENLSENSSDA